VTEQELDLLQIAAVLAAKLAQVLRRSCAPKRSMPISLADCSTTDHTAQSLKLSPTTLPFFKTGRRSFPSSRPGRGPGVDRLFDPRRDRHGADPAALAAEVRDYPPVLAHLDLLYIKVGQLVPAQGAADQEGQDHVVPLAFQGGAVGDGQKFPGLVAGQPVPQADSLLADVGMSVRPAASSDPIIPLRRASPTSFRTAESRTFTVEGERASMPARHSISRARERGWPAQKANRWSSASA
jgi:hypothetical protein